MDGASLIRHNNLVERVLFRPPIVISAAKNRTCELSEAGLRGPNICWGGIKKKAARRDSLLQVVFLTLFRADCFNWTYVSTCAAVSTELRINHINISFSNSFHGAFIDTGSTGSAIIRNYVSHIIKFRISLRQM